MRDPAQKPPRPVGLNDGRKQVKPERAALTAKFTPEQRELTYEREETTTAPRTFLAADVDGDNALDLLRAAHDRCEALIARVHGQHGPLTFPAHRAEGAASSVRCAIDHLEALSKMLKGGA